jgi:thymidylate synthase (FAD)
MDVKLISVTQSLVKNFMTPEELIVYIARVSNPSNQMNTETSDKLIRYLIKNKHWSPFEMVDMTIEIKTSRAIAAQILRHRSFSFQEFSQRYAEVNEMEDIQLRKQAATNRQSSEDAHNPFIECGTGMFSTESGNEIQISGGAQECIDNYISYGKNLYKALLAAGTAKECARMVLPLTTQTTIYMKGSVRSWIHYFQVRCDQHTQLEHRQVAEKAYDLFSNCFPNIHKAIIAE